MTDHQMRTSSILALRLLSMGPLSEDKISPSVMRRLRHEDLAEVFLSYGVQFWRITEAGLKRLREIDND